MKSPKNSRLFAMTVFPVIALGLLFALQTNTDNNPTGMQIAPGIIIPDGRGSDPFSIVPGDNGTKIEYRNILSDDTEKPAGAPPAWFFHA
jgi:hypothetical protein